MRNPFAIGNEKRSTMIDHSSDGDQAVVTKLSAHSVDDAAAALTALIEARDLRLFVVIDQAEESRRVRLV